MAQTLSGLLKDRKKLPLPPEVNPREREVLALVAEGLSNKEIAGRLFLSEGTVRNYVTALLEKLQLRDRTQLAIFFLNHD